MQQLPPVQMVGLGVIGLVVLAIVVVAGGFLALRNRYGIAVLAVLGLFVVAVIALPIVQQYREVLRRDRTRDQLKQIGMQLHNNRQIQDTPQDALNPPATGPTLSIIQYIAGNSAPIAIPELPAWRKNPPHEGTLGAGHCKYILTSQLFATPEEAEAELDKLLAVDVQQSFTVGNSPAVGWSPTADDLRMSGLVTEKVIETVPMKVGEFDTSVQRVSWLVEFTPASQQALLARWQPIEAQRRSKLILSVLAAISGIFGVSAFALRRNPTLPAPASQMA